MLNIFSSVSLELNTLSLKYVDKKDEDKISERPKVVHNAFNILLWEYLKTLDNLLLKPSKEYLHFDPI